MVNKSCRIIDGKARWVIVDDKGKIINKRPGKEDLKSLVIETLDRKTYNCDECNEELISGRAYKEYDKEGRWTYRWLCMNCWSRHNEKNNPFSKSNIMRSLRDHRIGNLDPNCSSAKGDMFEEITCMVRKVKNLNKENDNYRSPIDHSLDTEYGILQTKGAIYDSINGNWHCNWSNEHNKEFDNLIFYCMSKDRKNIERVYIFPRREVIRITTIGIYKNLSKGGGGWYEKYRVDEKPYNDAYHSLYENNKKQ